MEIAQAAPAAFQQYNLLSVTHHITDILARFSIIDHGTTWHINIYILAIGAVSLVVPAVTAVLSIDMLLITQVQKSPVVMVSAQDNRPALAAISTVRPAVRVIFDMLQVHGTTSALT